ncbi:MAG: hypothetical protein ABI318_22950 [Chthoniobacteraceae bacterium]
MLPQQFKQALDQLAHSGIFVGTSSWKYPGWCGQFYDEQRYLTRGKFSEAKFERECLAEYAQTFSTICVDAGYRCKGRSHSFRQLRRGTQCTDPGAF